MEHFVEAQIIENSSPESSTMHLKWVHIIIANAKRTFAGVYHKMKKNIFKIILMNLFTISTLDPCLEDFLKEH
jgi:hypothetical protein